MQITLSNRTVTNAKPFLKWAGGKTQLLDELEKRLPKKIKDEGVIENYVEPFIGGGAMFFHLYNKYEIKKSCILDINKELILGYKVIQKNPKQLINKLKKLEDEFLNKNDDERHKLYYKIRDDYNSKIDSFDFNKFSPKWVERVSYLIFLNKTCYNGLYRQNSKGEFNVPCGKYKNPTICDKENILEVNKALKNTKIICGDFSLSEKCIEEDSLVYLDPPYRPLNVTSSFTSYAKEGFTDKDQKRLASYFKKMHKKSICLILSNSDPKNENPDDNFFDKLYSKFKIERVPAKRFINCDATKRGEINELIITNC
jgi:DNA adenine methylase